MIDPLPEPQSQAVLAGRDCVAAGLDQLQRAIQQALA
jgi:hypothetical protein